VRPYSRLYRVTDWLHFVPLPAAGWLSRPRGAAALVGGVLAWCGALAFASAINQAFDDRLDRDGKNPVSEAFGRRRAIALSIPPAAGALALLAWWSPDGLLPAVVMMVAAAIYSAPPRLKRVPVVGTIWNSIIGVPGFFFAGRPLITELPLRPLAGLFALLLLVSQLLHEAADRDDDAGHVRTIATEAGRRGALIGALALVLATPIAGWWLAAGAARRPAIVVACGLFAVFWGGILGTRLRTDDRAVLQRMRLAYRYTALALGCAVFLALDLP
jgi:hypothetical protein